MRVDEVLCDTSVCHAPACRPAHVSVSSQSGQHNTAVSSLSDLGSSLIDDDELPQWAQNMVRGVVQETADFSKNNNFARCVPHQNIY
jgi:hypothetical protein